MVTDGQERASRTSRWRSVLGRRRLGTAGKCLRKWKECTERLLRRARDNGSTVGAELPTLGEEATKSWAGATSAWGRFPPWLDGPLASGLARPFHFHLGDL